jgi:hypothetical protein
MNDASSLVIKKGVTPMSHLGVTPMSHPIPPSTSLEDEAIRVSKSPDGAAIYGRHTLTSALDGQIADQAFRVLCLIECLAWAAPVELKHGEIADAMKCSRRHIIRQVQSLEALGRIHVRRTGNSSSEYSVPGITGVRIGKPRPAPKPTTKPSTTQELIRCPKCGGRCRQLLRYGWCRTCAWQMRVERIVEQKMAQEKTA